MSLVAGAVRNPYGVVAAALVVAALGLVGFGTLPTDLFPDTTPPQVLVLTRVPGAGAADVADSVTRVLEREMAGLPGLTKLSSTSADEVSSLRLEFGYEIDPGASLVEVQGALARVAARLPAEAQASRLHRIDDTSRPVLVLSVSPADGSARTLAETRYLADDDLRDLLLGLPGVGDVEVFGGERPSVDVLVDRAKLEARGVGLGAVVAAVAGGGRSLPAGVVYGEGREWLVRVGREGEDVAAVAALPLGGAGDLRVADVARVAPSTLERRSAYRADGRAAVALTVFRGAGVAAVDTIASVEGALPSIRSRWPDLAISIPESQKPLITRNVDGMTSSLGQAILLTVVVVWAFLGTWRSSAVVAASIPLSFLACLAFMKLTPWSLNMVTLSGLIISVGMVVDASVVVVENVQRLRDEGADPDSAVLRGAGEVALAITAGMATTVVVLLPLTVVGGYTQRILRPLAVVISVTLTASLVAALTVVPAAARRLLADDPGAGGGRVARAVAALVDGLAASYLGVVRLAVRRPRLVLGVTALLVVATVGLVGPIVGVELMPPMDTGIVTVELDLPSGTSPREAEALVARAEAIVRENPPVLSTSAFLGADPDAPRSGGGATAQNARMTVYLTDRTERAADVWAIQAEWREALGRLEGLRGLRVAEYGATPVATTRAPIDVTVRGPDPLVLDALAARVTELLKGGRGLLDVRRSWYRDDPVVDVRIDDELARRAGTSPAAVAREVGTALRGTLAGRLRGGGRRDVPVVVRLDPKLLSDPGGLLDLPVLGRHGVLPLRLVGRIVEGVDLPVVVREDLEGTVSVTASATVLGIAGAAAEAGRLLEGLTVPAGYRVEVGGTVADIARSRRGILGGLAVGVVLLYLLLVAMFASFRHPLTIMSAIPPAAAAALWGLLVFGKPVCMPAMMGFILLGGTIVNNSILLLEFIITAREGGVDREQAILDSVRLRLRPILMTTVSTVVGLTPLVLEQAVGLERMSPLGVVAAVGLAVGTLTTLVVTPAAYVLMDGEEGPVREA